MKLSSTNKTISTEEPAVFRKKILDWYDQHKRALPWRTLEGQTPDPYHVWLSEIMLQQTTVAAVVPYFNKFIDLWPDIHALADAPSEKIMQEWAGLGYYARARNLHKCAKIVSNELNGIFPSKQSELQKLPGIGDYTSAAITSITFNRPSVVVDGNVERVMARYHMCPKQMPEAKKALKQYAALYCVGFENRTGDYAQALMDLGATICTPKNPLCSFCPVNNSCQAYNKDTPDKYPLKKDKKKRPERYGYVYFIGNNKGEILLHKRDEKGLLGGMIGLPTSDWKNSNEIINEVAFLKQTKIQTTTHTIKHIFTHFSLILRIKKTVIANEYRIPSDYFWVSIEEFNTIKMPTVFKKASKLYNDT